VDEVEKVKGDRKRVARQEELDRAADLAGISYFEQLQQIAALEKRLAREREQGEILNGMFVEAKIVQLRFKHGVE
jgi:hypothetical protein